MSFETLGAAVAALFCGAALAYQIKSGRAIDWFGMEVTRVRSASLYWTYIALTAGAVATFVGIAAMYRSG